MRQLSPGEGALLHVLPWANHPALLLYATQRGGVHCCDLRCAKDAWHIPPAPSLGLVSQLVADPSGQHWLVQGTSRGWVGLWDVRFLLCVNSWQHPQRWVGFGGCGLLGGVWWLGFVFEGSGAPACPHRSAHGADECVSSIQSQPSQLLTPHSPKLTFISCPYPAACSQVWDPGDGCCCCSAPAPGPCCWQPAACRCTAAVHRCRYTGGGAVGCAGRQVPPGGSYLCILHASCGALGDAVLPAGAGQGSTTAGRVMP